jgi:hypothetical protein
VATILIILEKKDYKILFSNYFILRKDVLMIWMIMGVFV